MLKEKIHGTYSFRRGTNAEASTFKVMFVPHLVVLDAKGEALANFQAQALLKAQQSGNFVDTIVAGLPEAVAAPLN